MSGEFRDDYSEEALFRHAEAEISNEWPFLDATLHLEYIYSVKGRITTLHSSCPGTAITALGYLFDGVMHARGALGDADFRSRVGGDGADRIRRFALRCAGAETPSDSSAMHQPVGDADAGRQSFSDAYEAFSEYATRQSRNPELQWAGTSGNLNIRELSSGLVGALRVLLDGENGGENERALTLLTNEGDRKMISQAMHDAAVTLENGIYALDAAHGR